MLGVPPEELIILAATLFIAGTVTGILAGLFGVGGGAIIVPILYQAFIFVGVSDPIRMPLAVGTSLAIIIPTTLAAFFAHYARNAVDVQVVRLWAVPCFLGVLLGSAVASFAPPWVFKIVFILVAGANAAKLLAGRENWRLGDDLPDRPAMLAIGFAMGILSALMGISGGMLSNMTMILYGRSIHQAVATSAALGVVISLPGALGYILAGLPHAADLPPLSVGFVSIPALLLLTPMSLLFAPIGARLAHAISRRVLEIAYGLYLLAASVRFLVALV
jgi:uncharacterized membrane protein YfcA